MNKAGAGIYRKGNKQGLGHRDRAEIQVEGVRKRCIKWDAGNPKRC